MKAKESPIQGCYILEPEIFEDDRGYFFESFNQNNLYELIGERVIFVQDNESYSKKGVLRGLHFQTGDFAQAKLVRVTEGLVLDVVLDIRKDSKTYGQHFSIELSKENKKQLFIPRGLAHGFVVLSESATFCYKCDNFYNKSSEAGIIYNDPILKIDWKLPENELIISDKDKGLSSFKKIADDN